MDVDYLIREAGLLKYPVKSHVIGAQHGLVATCIDPRAVAANCLASFTNGRAVSSASDYQKHQPFCDFSEDYQLSTKN